MGSTTWRMPAFRRASWSNSRLPSLREGGPSTPETGSCISALTAPTDRVIPSCRTRLSTVRSSYRSTRRASSLSRFGRWCHPGRVSGTTDRFVARAPRFPPWAAVAVCGRGVGSLGRIRHPALGARCRSLGHRGRLGPACGAPLPQEWCAAVSTSWGRDGPTWALWRELVSSLVRQPPQRQAERPSSCSPPSPFGGISCAASRPFPPVRHGVGALRCVSDQPLRASVRAPVLVGWANGAPDGARYGAPLGSRPTRRTHNSYVRTCHTRLAAWRHGKSSRSQRAEREPAARARRPHGRAPRSVGPPPRRCSYGGYRCRQPGPRRRRHRWR